jgi:hypothetical protein
MFFNAVITLLTAVAMAVPVAESEIVVIADA